MNVKGLVVLLVVLGLIMPDQVDAGCKVVCRCGWEWFLRYVCKCGLECSRKRDVLSNAQPELLKPSFSKSGRKFTFRLPYNMALYDTNKDGRISYQEFKNIMPKPYSKDPIYKAFEVVDKNGDKYISCKELGKLAPNGKAINC